MFTLKYDKQHKSLYNVCIHDTVGFIGVKYEIGLQILNWMCWQIHKPGYCIFKTFGLLLI